MAEHRFVAREPQLAELAGYLGRALLGQGQVAFVLGEAGAGKTALIGEFARRSEVAQQDLVVAIGNCNAQTGIGDPYLPFREILSQLTGDVEAKLAQGAITVENARRLQGLVRWSIDAILEFGPDLINLLVPGSAMVAKASKFVLEQVGWPDKLKKLVESRAAQSGRAPLEQGHIFEQTTKVLKVLADRKPLVLVVDDLQWADAASISLLFHLGRRLSESRILLLGAYRSEEVQLGRNGGRHPLEKVLAEFKRYLGDVFVDLDQAEKDQARRFVDELLDTEPNRLGPGFRQALVRHTGGHALFAVELLRDLQERGILVRDAAGHWTEGRNLNWDAVPPRVEGVIEERIGRLERELQETLTVGSVEGEEFLAEVIARVREMDDRDVVRELSDELDKNHQLVASQGIRRLGPQALSAYRFRHSLFHTYLYQSLDAAQRNYLHADVGKVLEQLYGPHAEEIAVQLARHFGEAGLAEKASHYLYLAGKRATTLGANGEARKFFEAALELAPEGDLEARWRVLVAHDEAVAVLGDSGARQADDAALLALAERLGDENRVAEAHYRRGYHHYMLSHYAEGVEALDAALAVAERVGEAQVVAKSLPLKAFMLSRLGRMAEAEAFGTAGLAAAEALGDPEILAGALTNISLQVAATGDLARAGQLLSRQVEVMQQGSNLMGQALALTNLAYYYLLLGLYTRARTGLEQALALTSRTGARRVSMYSQLNLALVHWRTGDTAAARGLLDEAIPELGALGDTFARATGQTYLGLVLEQAGDVEGATAAFGEAHETLTSIGVTGSAADARAGLVRCCMERGDREGVRAGAEAVWSFLSNRTGGMEFPMLAYETCIRAFEALGLPELAATAAREGHALLMEQAGKISDPEWRQTFLRDVAEHRALVERQAASAPAQVRK